MNKTKNAKGKPDASEFFDSMDQEVLLQMIQYYPVQFKALCMLLSLDTQLVFEEEKEKNKTKKQIKKL